IRHRVGHPASANKDRFPICRKVLRLDLVGSRTFQSNQTCHSLSPRRSHHSFLITPPHTGLFSPLTTPSRILDAVSTPPPSRCDRVTIRCAHTGWIFPVMSSGMA